MGDVFQIKGPFNIQDLGDVSDLPGLYVWYARFSVGKADWNEHYAGGNELAASNLMKALRKHSLKFSRQQLEVSVKSNFSSLWKGAIEEQLSGKWKADEANEEQDNFSGRIGPAVANNRIRELLVGLLEESFPYFMSPLYVGKASDQTLRTRLRQHQNHYLDLWEKYSKDPQFADRIKDPKDFSERAIKLGFAPDDLFCMTVAIDQSANKDLDQADISQLINSAEWILNRWTTPVLGRQ